MKKILVVSLLVGFVSLSQVLASAASDPKLEADLKENIARYEKIYLEQRMLLNEYEQKKARAKATIDRVEDVLKQLSALPSVEQQLLKNEREELEAELTGLKKELKGLESRIEEVQKSKNDAGNLLSEMRKLRPDLFKISR